MSPQVLIDAWKGSGRRSMSNRTLHRIGHYIFYRRTLDDMTESGLECNNKVLRLIRIGLSRKTSQIENLSDCLERIWIKSDLEVRTAVPGKKHKSKDKYQKFLGSSHFFFSLLPIFYLFLFDIFYLCLFYPSFLFFFIFFFLFVFISLAETNWSWFCSDTKTKWIKITCILLLDEYMAI